MAYERKEPKYIRIWSWFTPRLPAEYQEVEWIESSWTQYIDTWWYPSSNYCKVVMDWVVYTWSGSWSVFFWMTNWSNAYSLHTNHSTWYFNLGSSININTNISFSNWTDGTFTFDADNGSISVDIAGSTYTGTYSWSVAQSNRPMYIFAFDESWSTTWKTNMKLRELKIYSDASTLERDFIPCYRIADSVIWLYDLENDQFYTNSWTGVFGKWADVNVPFKSIKKVYLGSTQIRPTWWQPWADNIVYFPLDNDITDYTGTYTLTPTSASIIDFNWVKCLDCTNGYAKGTIATLPQWASARTNMYRIYFIGRSGLDRAIYWYGAAATPYRRYDWNYVGSDWNIAWQCSGYWLGSNYALPTWWWHHVACTRDSSNNMQIYVDWSLKNSWQVTFNTEWTDIWLWVDATGTTPLNWYLSKFTVEGKQRTAQEVLDYYNETKWDYWIS